MQNVLWYDGCKSNDDNLYTTYSYSYTYLHKYTTTNGDS